MSSLARVVFSPDTTPPTTPGSVTASALSQTAIRITWGAATDTGGSGLAGYRVYRSTTSTGTYSQIGADLTTASLSYDDTGLAAGTTRFYRIVAFDGNANVSSQSSTASATTQAANPETGLTFPAHTPGYLSLLPEVGGYGMQTVAGSGRHLSTPATTVILVNSLASGNVGGALSGLGANVFGGTFEYAWRHSASPKVIIPIVSGWVQIQASIPCQTGTPPRPGYVTYYGQAAPNPGLFLRGANVATNGASDLVAWHLRSYMGDDVAGVGAGNRDCFSSGYADGTTARVVLINCEFAWSVDEIVDFNRSHSEITLVNCAFIEPLHVSTIVHPEDGPGVDHGFGPIIGGDTGSPQTEAVACFRNLWAHTTGRNPLISARTFVHANNLHYNHGRPGTGTGNAVQIIGAGATEANYANIVGNAFVRGPNNNTTLAAISVTGSFPAGSAGHSALNAQFGWTAPANQNAFFTAAPAGYIASSVQTSAYPGSWGTGLSAVLQWAANPLAPTTSEWNAFVELMSATVGAQPRYRTTSVGRVGLVINQIRDRIAGVAQSDQFVDTVTEAGGWFSVSSVTIDPLNPGTHWHAPLPIAADRDTPYTSGTFSNGKSRVGYTRLEEWAYEQHLYVSQVDLVSPAVPINVQAAAQSQTTIRVTWDATTDTGGSGLAGYRVYRATTSGGTYTQVGGDLAATTTSFDDATLTAGTTRFYRVAAFDAAGNASSQSATASATTTTGVGNDGLIVTNAANYNPDAAQIISIDVNSTLSTAISTGASVQIANEIWWSGTTGVATIRPPTIGNAYAGFNNISFWRNAQKQVRQVNIRFEWRASDLFCANTTTMPKWIIVRTARTFNSLDALQDRAMLYINHMDLAEGTPTQYRLADVLTFCPAQGTVRMYSTQNFTPATLHSQLDDVTRAGNARFPAPFVVRASAGTDSVGNPIIDADEFLCVEMRVNVMSTTDEPNGVIGVRITRRNGQILERCCAWTYWPDPPGGVTVNTNYIADIDVMGAGYFNNANSGDANIWNKVGRRLTFGTNIQPTVGRAWIGPPTGFVQ
jgi:fibronectin type 3 domain-containing protein